MNLLRLFEGVMVLLLLVFVISEVIGPFAKGTRYFPHFRKATPLEKQVRVVEDGVVEVTELADAQAALRDAERRLAELRCPPCPHPKRCAADKVCLAFQGHPPETDPTK